MSLPILRWTDADQSAIRRLLSHYGLTLQILAANQTITGSYWGDDEAGLIGHTVHVRGDTPVHSILHEACHAICMGPARRAHLHTDAGGDDQEENAVCYLQIMLAQSIPGFGSSRCCQDMDAWGYSFRLGSAQAWFEQDAQDARSWLDSKTLLP
jgi:hypothetical protein